MFRSAWVMRHCMLTSPLCRWCRATHGPPVVTAPVYRGCLCRDPLGCHRCPGMMASGAERQSLWLRCAGGGGHVMWTLLMHAFYKHFQFYIFFLISCLPFLFFIFFSCLIRFPVQKCSSLVPVGVALRAHLVLCRSVEHS